MAVTSLQAESAQTNPTSSRALYYAYRRAKAAWDIALYAPELLDDDCGSACKKDPVSGVIGV
ncbi:hypothetical protein ACGGKE_08615 [Sphingobium naphthae]|uniref:hypothetical protein n=1 Tax=Sphingobium naphthae TaxID=1886786 RepID=UPI0037484EDD